MRDSVPQMRVSMSLMNQVDGRERELRLWLLSAATHRGVTYYRIAGRFTSSGQTWEVSHRYSEFLKLRDKLVKFLSSSTDKCPGCRNYLHAIQRFDFPKKHLFASRAPIVVNYRVKALRSFLNLLASWAFSKSPKCPTCGGFAFDVVRNFVCEGDDPSADVDMNSIRESVVVEAFAGPNASSRGSTFTHRHSWIPASGSMALETDSTQSFHQPRPSRQEQKPVVVQSSRGPPRTKHHDQERHSAVQSSRGASKPREPHAKKAHARVQPPPQPQHKQRHHLRDDDPYDAFNDYLPARPSHLKKSGQSSMETHADNGKFSARTLSEEAKQRQQRYQREQEEDADDESFGGGDARHAQHQRLMRKHRSEPHNLSARRPLADSELSVSTSNFESPRSAKSKKSTGSTPQRHFDSFFSEVSMAAEPVIVPGDQRRFAGLSSDEEAKNRADSSVYSSEDEIDITGVAHASPPRRSTRKASTDNLWQPWELARVA